MKVYAQHGYGKSQKIDQGLDEGLLDGVIFGPNNERPDNLRECVTRLSEHDTHPELLIDPQLYVSLLNNPKEGNLPLYEEYYVSNLTLRDFTPRRTSELVKQSIDFQLTMPVTRVLSPTLFLENFSDRSAQVAHFLAQSAMDYHAGLRGAPPLLLSYVFHETALPNSEQVAEFLDTISLYSAQGFYLVLSRGDGQYQQAFEPNKMAQWLMILYSLSMRNRFEVVCGYTDFLALPAASVGAYAAATGWFNSLRQFDLKRFLPSTGGRRPKSRYSSAPLMNSIFIQELDNCYEAGRLQRVLTGTTFDRVFRDGRPIQQNWPDDISTLHHWATLRKLVGQIPTGRVPDRIAALDQQVSEARRLYTELRQKGVEFDPSTSGAHLSNWADALEVFRGGSRL